MCSELNWWLYILTYCLSLSLLPAGICQSVMTGPVYLATPAETITEQDWLAETDRSRWALRLCLSSVGGCVTKKYDLQQATVFLLPGTLSVGGD